jgi:hypothetical protein
MSTQAPSCLIAIQAELRAPKNQYNHFGKYSYRSCEDILEAVKPLLKKHGCKLTISDSVECIGNRVYVCAIATFWEPAADDGKTTTVRAYAREPEAKKGMDESQITGAASSYARKYALNGLFLIDDSKDADYQPTGVPDSVKAEVQAIQTVEALEQYYKENIGKHNGNKEEFIKLLADRKAKLKGAA